ncbi:MAG: SAM-dependent methyltransferase, partial [Acidimicrobiales bacterium]
MREPVVAEALRPLLEHLLRGEPAVSFRFWDGSTFGPAPPSPATPSPTTVVLRSPRALRRILWSPNELGFARAYVADELDVEGDIYAALGLREQVGAAGRPGELGLGARGWLRALEAARRFGVLGAPLAAPPEEMRVRGRRHSRE